MAKQLFRSRANRVIGGVCGGLGEHFDMDPIFIRAVFLVSLFFGGLGLLIYIILWILMPSRPSL